MYLLNANKIESKIRVIIAIDHSDRVEERAERRAQYISRKTTKQQLPHGMVRATCRTDVPHTTGGHPSETRGNRHAIAFPPVSYGRSPLSPIFLWYTWYSLEPPELRCGFAKYGSRRRRHLVPTLQIAPTRTLSRAPSSFLFPLGRV